MKIIGGVWAMFNPIISFAEGFKADPETIEIGYNEQKTVEIGVIDMETGEFGEVRLFSWLRSRFLTFEAEFPGGNPGGVWFVSFDPPTANAEHGKTLTTKVTISLTAPPMADKPIQSDIIRIKISDAWMVGNLWFPTDPSYWGSMWVIGALPPPIGSGFGKLSGTTQIEDHYVDILVTVKPYHAVNFEAQPLIKLQPNQITSIPIEIENLGNYNDSFNFKITSEHDNIKLTDPGSITLSPGEIGHTAIGVAVSPLALDTGTLHAITIEPYSIEQPNVTLASQKIFLETQGVYVSEVNAFYSGLFGIIILFVIAIILYIRRRRNEKIGKKPDKPWKIPEEKKHLKVLKGKDKNEYDRELKMMEDEYQSALLWYDNYHYALKKQRKIKKPKSSKKENNNLVKNFFKKPEKTEQKNVEKEEKPEIVKKQQVKIDREAVLAKRKKEKALLKIQRQQKKQRRKLGQYSN